MAKLNTGLRAVTQSLRIARKTARRIPRDYRAGGTSERLEKFLNVRRKYAGVRLDRIGAKNRGLRTPEEIRERLMNRAEDHFIKRISKGGRKK